MKYLLVFLVMLISIFVYSGEKINDYEVIEKNKIKFYWRINGDYLDIKVSAKCKGWISVGIDPIIKMKDADIIIAYIKKGKVFAQDSYGVTPIYHKSDVELGGEDNITNITGKEKNGLTEIAFSIPIDSGDKYDKKIKNGKHLIILAFSDKDDLDSKHRVRTSVEINLN